RGLPGRGSRRRAEARLSRRRCATSGGERGRVLEPRRGLRAPPGALNDPGGDVPGATSTSPPGASALVSLCAREPAREERGAPPRCGASHGSLLWRRGSALLEEPLQARGMDPVVLAAVVADDLEGRAVVDHGFDLGAIQGREGRDQARLAAPTLEAHRGLVQVREGHTVEQLVAQAHGGEVLLELPIDVAEVLKT